nr:MAG TPA: hypothetical protein [Caudoviricetes sp.]
MNCFLNKITKNLYKIKIQCTKPKPQAITCGFLFAQNRKNSDGAHCFSCSVWA